LVELIDVDGKPVCDPAAGHNYAVRYAAEGGHLEILKWLHKNGCPWNEETREIALKKWPNYKWD
jgi:hypothetical protein